MIFVESRNYNARGLIVKYVYFVLISILNIYLTTEGLSQINRVIYIYICTAYGVISYFVSGNYTVASLLKSEVHEIYEGTVYNPLSCRVHGCINLIFIILSILFNLFICINLVYFFVFLFNYFIYLNFTYSECNASKGLSHN